MLDDNRFTRGHGKFDDTFYESRVCSLSKTRAQRQTMFEDITNVQNRNPTQSANVLNRLINMRKLKEADTTSFCTGDTDSIEESSQAEELDNRRQLPFPNYQNLGQTYIRDASGDRLLH